MIDPIGHVLIVRTFAHRPDLADCSVLLCPSHLGHDLWLVRVLRCTDHRPVIGGALVIANGIYIYRLK
jgi:hypothetical protein